MHPLVSIITPTFNRHDSLLNRTIPSIKRQNYPNIEHIIVSDKPDPELEELLKDKGVKFLQLGRNWGGFLRGEGTMGVGSMPRNIGVYFAKGEMIGYLDDDDEFLPEHVTKLVYEIQTKNVDFAFSKMRQVRQDGSTHNIVGSGQILYGHVGSPMIIHKIETFKKVEWPRTDGYDEDFQFYTKMRDAGFTYSFINEITIDVHMRL